MNYMQATINSGPLKGRKVFLALTNRELYSVDTEDKTPVTVFEENGGEMLMHEVRMTDLSLHSSRYAASPDSIGDIEPEDAPKK